MLLFSSSAYFVDLRLPSGFLSLSLSFSLKSITHLDGFPFDLGLGPIGFLVSH
jgi:hypothetical protein